VISRNPDQVTAMHGVTSVATLSTASARALLRADAICIGGGGMFGRGLPPLVRLLPWAGLLARLLGKRIYFLSIGAYDDTPWTTKTPLRLLARTADLVTVRDTESARTLRTGLAQRVTPIVVDDPSLAVPPASPSRVAEFLHTTIGHRCTEPPLVVNLKAMPDPQHLHHVLDTVAAGLADWAARNNGPITFLSMSATGDYGLGPTAADHILAQQIIDNGQLHTRASIVGPLLEPALAKGLCRDATAVIAMRLHAQIFAATTGTPLLGISFEPKSHAWLTGVGADQIVHHTLTPRSITDWLAIHQPTRTNR